MEDFDVELDLCPRPRWSAANATSCFVEKDGGRAGERTMPLLEEGGLSPSMLLEDWIKKQSPPRPPADPSESSAAASCRRRSATREIQGEGRVTAPRPSLKLKFQSFKDAMEEHKEREEELARRRRSVRRLIAMALEAQCQSEEPIEVADDSTAVSVISTRRRRRLARPSGLSKAFCSAAMRPVFLNKLMRRKALRKVHSLRRPLRPRRLPFEFFAKTARFSTQAPLKQTRLSEPPQGTAAETNCISSCKKRRSSLLARCAALQRCLLESQRLNVSPMRWTQRLRVESLIGRGSSGSVWKVQDAKTGRRFALKVLNKRECQAFDRGCRRAFSERHVLIRGSRLCRYLVRLEAAFQDERRLFLLQELVEGPSLQSLVAVRGRNALPEPVVKKIGFQLALALNALHSLGFAHRDVKPANIRFDARGCLKLLDVGLAFPVSPREAFCEEASEGPEENEFEETQQVRSLASRRLAQFYEGSEGEAFAGTLHYMAPELISRKDVAPSTAHDWWSFGATLFECLFGHPPFAKPLSTRPENAARKVKFSEEEETQRETEELPSLLGSGFVEANVEFLVSAIQNWKNSLHVPPPPWNVRAGQPLSASSQDKAFEVSEEAAHFLKQVLTDKTQRLGFEEIKRHPWFKEVNWKERGEAQNDNSHLRISQEKPTRFPTSSLQLSARTRATSSGAPRSKDESQGALTDTEEMMSAILRGAEQADGESNGDSSQKPELSWTAKDEDLEKTSPKDNWRVDFRFLGFEYNSEATEARRAADLLRSQCKTSLIDS